jgi:hypothetical protein
MKRRDLVIRVVAIVVAALFLGTLLVTMFIH